MDMAFTNFSGPGDDALFTGSEIGGYQPYSRIGEVVTNAIPDTVAFQMLGVKTEEPPPSYDDWATFIPGMVCIARHDRNEKYRGNYAAQSAQPVVSCAQCLSEDDELFYYFAGVCRSKSIQKSDPDAVTLQVNDFTLTVGGIVTVLNTSNRPITEGRWVAWTLNQASAKKIQTMSRGGSASVRRIGIRLAHNEMDPCIIGRAVGGAMPGQPFDLLMNK